MASAAVLPPAAQPLDRSLSKMMMRAEAGGDDAETDMYAQYKLKQREHEFLKIQVRRRHIARGAPLASRPLAIVARATDRCPAAVRADRVHQGRAAPPQARDAARAGGGQAHPVGAARDRPVPGGGGREHGHRGLDDGQQLLRADPEHDQPRVAQAQRLGRAAPALQRPGRGAAAGGRLEHLDDAGEAQGDVLGHRRVRHPEAGDPRGGRASADAV